MPVDQLQNWEYERAKIERELARLKATLASRDELVRRIRAEQQWTTEALDNIHIPVLAFEATGDLFWLNEGGRLLFSPPGVVLPKQIDLPNQLDEVVHHTVETHSENPPDKAMVSRLKLHGQDYRLHLQAMPKGAASKMLIQTGLIVKEPVWLASLMPHQAAVAETPAAYPELPEVPSGSDQQGRIEIELSVAGQSLAVALRPVVGLQQFLGTEQLVRLEYQALPSMRLDLALVENLCARVVSDRLATVGAGVWMLRLSNESLHNREFSAQLNAIFSKYQMDASRFVFGVAEMEVMDALVLVKRLQSDLYSSNLRWALLDTTADLSNFEYFAPLGIDFYCVSADLVAQAVHEKRAQQVLRALRDAASGQGMATLATGVDTSAAMAMVRAAGIDYASGEWTLKRDVEG